MTGDFNAFCLQHNVTPDERVELLWHLAMLRLRATLEISWSDGCNR